MRISFLLVGISVIICGCGQPEVQNTESSSKTKKAPVTFSNSDFFEITPLADGGAYVTNLDDGLWYIRGSEAIQVKFPNHSKSDNKALNFEITPLLNGGAYAHSILDKTIWYLKGDTAVKVTEVQSLSEKMQVEKSGTVNFFPMYALERKKRVEAEQNNNE